jgi:hypothetical protein
MRARRGAHVRPGAGGAIWTAWYIVPTASWSLPLPGSANAREVHCEFTGSPAMGAPTRRRSPQDSSRKLCHDEGLGFLGSLITTLALFASCSSDETPESSANGKRSHPPQNSMNDPEMIQLDEAVRKHPNRAEVYWSRASACFNRARYDRAARDIAVAAATRRSPDLAFSVCGDAMSAASWFIRTLDEKVGRSPSSSVGSCDKKRPIRDRVHLNLSSVHQKCG